MKRLITGFTAVAIAAVAAASLPSSTPVSMVPVIVQAADEARAAQAVVAAGGIVDRSLPLVDGVAAHVSAPRLDDVATAPDVRAVTPNASLQLYSETSSDGHRTLAQVARTIRAHKPWAEGITGAGIDIALIDSGVAPVPGLDAPGKVVHGPDLSFDADVAEARHLDAYGHGTHMAGILAARDRLGTGEDYASGHAGLVGIAPDARVVSVKVADASGATDVSLVIAAIDWVIAHRDRDGLNIRVLNLSFGTDGVQDAALDPLTFAVQQAWHAGIVVVVAGGNDGESRIGLSNPARDPYVIAVGAADTKATTDHSDDVVPAWSGRGDSARTPDLVAPGRSIASLRVPGSFIDEQHPDGRVSSDARLFRGSGTSQAAAVTSAAAALLLEQRPWLTPDDVKLTLTNSARDLPNEPAAADGAGIVDVAPATWGGTTRGQQDHALATGTGTLAGARGSFRTAWSDDDPERTAHGTHWDPAAVGSWSGGAWQGDRWSGGTWHGVAWGAGDGGTWSGGTWTGGTWTGGTWTGGTWTGGTWTGGTWTGGSWTSGTWS